MGILFSKAARAIAAASLTLAPIEAARAVEFVTPNAHQQLTVASALPPGKDGAAYQVLSDAASNDLTIRLPGLSWMKGLLRVDPSISANSDSPLTSRQIEDQIMALIRKRIKSRGTIGTLYIDGHGSPNSMYAWDKQSVEFSPGDSHFDVGEFLAKIKKLNQEDGVKSVGRIVFEGCHVFANLSPYRVAYYRQTAKDLSAQIIGSTNIVYSDIIHRATQTNPSGAFVQFNPDGSVARNSDIHAVLLEAAPVSVARLFINSLEDGYSGQWANCHIGKTQDEGAACQQKTEPASRLAGEARQDLESIGHENPKSDLYDPAYPIFLFNHAAQILLSAVKDTNKFDERMKVYREFLGSSYADAVTRQQVLELLTQEALRLPGGAQRIEANYSLLAYSEDTALRQKIALQILEDALSLHAKKVSFDEDFARGAILEVNMTVLDGIVPGAEKNMSSSDEKTFQQAKILFSPPLAPGQNEKKPRENSGPS